MNATKTAEGIIPHYRYRGLDCPVKLKLESHTDYQGILVDHMSPWRNLPAPLRSPWGALVYALPGGGQIVGPDHD